MKASQFFIATLKEAPADAEIASHKLMMRAGFIKRLGAGIYSYMPMGLRVIRKVETIIREEMNRAGAIELLMPVVQPAELWQETGRWNKMGPELLRVKDRHERDFIIQPTSEEVVTDIARQELRSYRQLPRNFYHIQTKFRDERRPRFGVMRGREFTMKDAYSFDRDVESAGKSYEAMYRAYCAIFDRMGLQYRAVAADTGAIGGDRSHEFQVIADTGEDAIVYNPSGEYAANIELAEAVALIERRSAPSQPLTKTPTPGKSTCEDVAELLKLPLAQTVKSLVLATDDKSESGDVTRTTVWLLLVRGDHALNEVKAGKVDGLKDGFRFATAAEIESHFGTKPGYLGPIRTQQPVKVVADIRNVVEGDPAPDGKGTLAIQRGIEVGHVFFLGTKYSEPMNATYLDEAGKPQLLQMGCYGIGVTRILGAAIEQNHDAKGIAWPAPIAPFEVVICPIGYDRNADVQATAQRLHDELAAAGLDVVLDDRGERPGAMFADWELIGVPQRVVVSDRGLKEGKLEVQGRREDQATTVPLADVVAFMKGRLRA